MVGVGTLWPLACAILSRDLPWASSLVGNTGRSMYKFLSLLHLLLDWKRLQFQFFECYAFLSLCTRDIEIS